MTLKQQCQRTEIIMAKINSLGRYPTDQEWELICSRYGVPSNRYKRIFYAHTKLPD